MEKEKVKQIADEIENLSLQDQLKIASRLIDHGRYGLAEIIAKRVSAELCAHLHCGKKIVSNGGLKTFGGSDD